MPLEDSFILKLMIYRVYKFLDGYFSTFNYWIENKKKDSKKSLVRKEFVLESGFPRQTFKVENLPTSLPQSPYFQTSV